MSLFPPKTQEILFVIQVESQVSASTQDVIPLVLVGGQRIVHQSTEVKVICIFSPGMCDRSTRRLGYFLFLGVNGRGWAMASSRRYSHLASLHLHQHSESCFTGKIEATVHELYQGLPLTCPIPSPTMSPLAFVTLFSGDRVVFVQFRVGLF